MKAELYIVNYSFHHQTGVSQEDLEERIKSLALDCDYIRRYKESDKIYVHPSVYDEIIYPGITVSDFLYLSRNKSQFDRDIRNSLQTIIDKSETTDITVREIVEVLLEQHSEELVFGLICLHKIEKVDEKYLIYNKHNWLEFHRHFLGLYPKNSVFYISECSKYFPNLFFHERNIGASKKILPKFARKIIDHLSALNDKFSDYKFSPYNRNETLKQFSSGCKLDEKATSEGNIQHKPFFTFVFKNSKGEDEQVCCEPHLKLCYSDNHPGDGEYYQHRVYFHEGKKNIAGGKILIGHIGEHIKF